jgi:tight adherence protein B
MSAALLAVAAATGVYLLFGSWAFPSNQMSSVSKIRLGISATATQRLELLGITKDQHHLAMALVGGAGLLGALVGWLVFGGVIAPAVLGLFVATLPIETLRRRLAKSKMLASDSWPQMIEELRLRCTSMGESIPQALFAVGANGPEFMRPAFEDAQREWLVSTDFRRCALLLKTRLDDPIADVVCETLVVANEVGGNRLGQHLQALIDDRRDDLRSRKEARAKQAGVRFARKFVLVVPAGMAVVGLSIGDGRSAYESVMGQLGIGLALGVLAACWWWAGRLIRLPEPRRIFNG